MANKHNPIIGHQTAATTEYVSEATGLNIPTGNGFTQILLGAQPEWNIENRSIMDEPGFFWDTDNDLMKLKEGTYVMVSVKLPLDITVVGTQVVGRARVATADGLDGRGILATSGWLARTDNDSTVSFDFPIYVTSEIAEAGIAFELGHDGAADCKAHSHRFSVLTLA